MTMCMGLKKTKPKHAQQLSTTLLLLFIVKVGENLPDVKSGLLLANLTKMSLCISVIFIVFDN